MAEAIHCPSCSTRYRLRPERLRPVVRRAKCLSCGGVFPVGDIVQRLLAPPAPAATASFSRDLVDVTQHGEPEAPATLETSLTLNDLDGVDAEILEKTLVEAPAALPEAKAAAPSPAAFPPEITESTLSGYTSARDAIDKLFGSAPAAKTGGKSREDSNAMDMEATLSALETTLGGPVPTPPAAIKGDDLTSSGLTEDDLSGPSSSTLRISQEDLQAIVDRATTPAAEPTVALRASDFMPSAEARAEAAALATPRAFSPLAEAPEAGSELLRLKIGEEIYGGLTMPQLIAWVEEGRILEHHLVARQHSENWLDAHKVPGLRPVFERLRRERSGGAPSLDAGLGDSGSKKSLFGGLFGKN